MALSPNYNWAEPDNSSLVKNGAADIRTLGDAIDTSVWNVGFGQAGKNKIINGDFGINQRSFSSTTLVGYIFDRWNANCSDGTNTYSAQTFTTGAAPVAGYEGKNYLRIISSGQTNTGAFTRVEQRIENVRTFAGQTITVSFWAQAGSGTPSVSVELQQNFGTGGSPSTTVNGIISATPKQAISTSWVRYSFTIAVPSISGKTIGTNENSFLQVGIFVSAGSDLNARTGSLGIQSGTFNFWGVQAEYGSKATPFQTATGTIQGELAACQRYYYRVTAVASGRRWANGFNSSTGGSVFLLNYPVTMRTQPTALEQSGTAGDYTIAYESSVATATSVPAFSTATEYAAIFTISATGLTSGQAVMIRTANASAYLGWSAEL